jgi:hypothetical protein
VNKGEALIRERCITYECKLRELRVVGNGSEEIKN